MRETLSIVTVETLRTALCPAKGARTADGHEIAYAILYASGGEAYVKNVVVPREGDAAPNSDVAHRIPVDFSTFEDALAQGIIERNRDSYAGWNEYHLTTRRPGA